MKRIEALGQDFIKSQQRRRIITSQERVNQREAIFIVQHIQVAENILILHVSSAECHCLVKYSQGITHCSISLVRNDMK